MFENVKRCVNNYNEDFKCISEDIFEFERLIARAEKELASAEKAIADALADCNKIQAELTLTQIENKKLRKEILAAERCGFELAEKVNMYNGEEETGVQIWYHYDEAVKMRDKESI
jgi:septal ring factor EnvC (AmiA/AmiB activator)